MRIERHPEEMASERKDWEIECDGRWAKAVRSSARARPRKLTDGFKRRRCSSPKLTSRRFPPPLPKRTPARVQPNRQNSRPGEEAPRSILGRRFVF